MDSKNSEDLVNDLINLGVHKAHSSIESLLLKGFHSGCSC